MILDGVQSLEFLFVRFDLALVKTNHGALTFKENIAKTSEVAYWASLPLGFDIKRLSIAGSVTGF